MGTAAARARREELHRQQEEAHRREHRRRIVRRVGLVVILALVAAVVTAAFRSAMQSEGAPPQGSEVPAHTVGPTIPVGAESAPVTVTIYYDYLCPACGLFEEANGEELADLLDSGEVRLELRPVSFLDRFSEGTRYSTRAANAIATVADAAPERVLAFHTALFEAQPAEGTPGLTDGQLADLAVEAGVPADVADRFADGDFEGWVARMTRKAFDAGVSQTPTVLVDGKELTGNLTQPGVLAKAVAAAEDSP